MTLSRRTMLLTGGALLALMAGLWVVVAAVMLGGFRKVEERSTRLHVERASEAIDLAAETLATKLTDWSMWDDTYAFVDDLNAEYATSNLTAKGLESLGLHAMVFFGKDGTLLHAVTLTPSASGEEPSLQTTPPEGFMRQLAEHPDLLVSGENEADVRAGVVSWSERIFLIASRPVLTSEATGPSRGALLFIAELTEERIAAMGERLRMTLALRPLADADPHRLQDISAQAAIEPVDLNTIRGRTILADIRGEPAFAIDVAVPRFVHAQALATSKLLGITLAIAAFVTVVVVALVLRLTVLGRLAQLHGEVASIGGGDAGSGSDGEGDPLVANISAESRVTVEGRDELSNLAATLNGLFRRIANAHSDLASARAAAERANLAKSEFLANMSHEVRTPLTAILGFADLLADGGQVDPAAREGIDTIRRNGRHLLAVINDILDLSKIEAGRMDVETLPCSPVLLAREIIDLLRDRATQKGLSLALAIEGRVPSIVTTDPLRFRQILLNLTGNAIKFTPSGGVTLRLSFPEPDATSPPRLLVDICDTGIGITTEQEARLFRAYGQAEQSTARQFGGTGLGLTISRKLATLLGGDLTLHATGPNGSTFRISIATGPLTEDIEFVTQSTADAAAACSTNAPPPAAQSIDLSGLSILLAEDGPDNQRLLGFVLRKAGAKVEIVGDGRRAVDAALAARQAQRPFDLILMDIQMPLMDGFSATRALRAARITTPIVALTAHAMEGDRAACLAAGCDDYASKPIDRTALLQTCRRAALCERRAAA
jgi:signal transduction histidine kinase/ActR/RegA family two-component response regulator